MEHTFLSRAERCVGEARRRRRRHRAVTALSSVVVFCTTYALILPAITMEHTCGMEEHTHSEHCYTQLLPPENPEAICGLVEDEIHRHTAECYAPAPASPDVLTCENTDPAHEHGVLCYGDWTLTCPLPEHTHDAGCDAQAVPSETADESEPRAGQPVEESSAPEPEADETPGVLETALSEVRTLFSAKRTAAVPTASRTTPARAASNVTTEEATVTDPSGSGSQINKAGGTASAGKDVEQVKVSKVISGTEIENVFDITLTVETPQTIDEITQEPDMAVVIVMDISATMTSKFPENNSDGTTRYTAAVAAAEKFLDQFAASNSLGVSKVGFVAFNTNAYEIFPLQECKNETQATNLKNIMKNQTGNIIYRDGYKADVSRFTNIQAGLKRAQDMLDQASNQNKFVIFLSDGFPTTYIKSDYEGYNPYNRPPTDTGTPAGVDYGTTQFYDRVSGIRCRIGTSYSDEAAICARKQATIMKEAGTTIFSIGIDVGGQTIQAYVDAQDADGTYSLVDRTSTDYELGSATDSAAFRNWLKNRIGSGYYYDSNNAGDLQNAYSAIFQQIKQQVEVGSEPDWVTTDPLPSISPTGEVDFIGLFDKDGILRSEKLSGNHAVGAENTADCSEGDDGNPEILWDLKASGYQKSSCTFSDGNHGTLYTYSLKYRVRLKNEDSGFVESKIYATNDETYLRYRVIRTEGNTVTISEPTTIPFLVPSVHGYLGELAFSKQDDYGNAVAGAGFTLRHADTCHTCRGDGKAVTVSDMTATSGEDGAVTFSRIPSGHTYILEETTVPDGYSENGNSYTVNVAYDKVTVTVKDYNQRAIENGWNGVIVNTTYYELPATGGSGTAPYTLGGLSLLALSGLLWVRRRRRKGAAG